MSYVSTHFFRFPFPRLTYHNNRNFVRVSSGPELGAYYHEFFLRDKPHLAAQMFCKNLRSKLAMSTSSKAPPQSGEATDEEKKAPAQAPAAAPQQQFAFASASHNPVVTLPPDIPLGLLEALTKGPSGLDASSGARVPGRLVQQSQYANMLVERQIQILQQEQAKLMLIREAAARQQQQQLYGFQQQQQQLDQGKPQQDPESLRQLMDIKAEQKQGRGPVNHRASAA